MQFAKLKGRMTVFSRFTFKQRQTLERDYRAGVRMSEIAKKLNFDISNIYRELQRGSGGKKDEKGRYIYTALGGQEANFNAMKTRAAAKKQVNETPAKKRTRRFEHPCLCCEKDESEPCAGCIFENAFSPKKIYCWNTRCSFNGTGGCKFNHELVCKSAIAIYKKEEENENE